MKRCFKCGKPGPFGVDRSKKDGLRCWCKPCAVASSLRSQRKNPNHYRAYRMRRYTEMPEVIKDEKLRSLYGISLLEFKKLCREQSGRCGICKRPSKLTVDHCHRSDRVRGLLCGNCNRALGLFKESIDSLLRAVRYLKKNKNTLTKVK